MKLRTNILLLSLISWLALVAEPTSRYELNVGDFTELKVIDGINVDYHCDPSKAGKVEFVSDADMASAVIFEPSKKGKLEIKLSTPETAYTNVPTVTVYSSALTRVENSGDSTVRILSVVPTSRFQAKLTGNGRISVRDIEADVVEGVILTGRGIISLRGKCQETKLSLTGGAAQIQADELRAADVTARLYGTGSINCFATTRLSVKGLGSGTVYYRGNPQVDKGFAAPKVVALDATSEDQR